MTCEGPRMTSDPMARWLGHPMTRSPGGPTVAFELLGLVMRDQRVDDVVDLAVHHAVELVKVQTDAVVGEPVLREVVGADFLAAVARADLRAALFGDLLLRSEERRVGKECRSRCEPSD